MIFVIVGTERYPFDRLAEEIDVMKAQGVIKTDVFMQLGSCHYIPRNCSWERYLPFDKMVENIKQAEFVIAHAGAGTTLLCLQLDKKPIIVTRQKKNGEHLDNHQIPFGKNMRKLNYAFVAFDVVELRECFDAASKELFRPGSMHFDNSQLIGFLNSYIDS